MFGRGCVLTRSGGPGTPTGIPPRDLPWGAPKGAPQGHPSDTPRDTTGASIGLCVGICFADNLRGHIQDDLEPKIMVGAAEGRPHP